ncbi:MAG: hypothetical protein IT433_12040 [Phycisphaerales bacterium]|nr:hypothetical protein [Phycisphaerales bacterium]
MAKKQTPPFLKRRVAWFVLLIVGLSLTSPVVTYLLRNKVPALAYVAATAIPGLGSGLLSMWFGRAMLREVKQAECLGWKRCWHCGYDLTGAAADGLCPECGNAYTRENLAAKWRLLAHKQAPKSTPGAPPTSPAPSDAPGATSPPGA